MKGWEMFWVFCLIVAGSAFALITLIVAAKGVKDLREMLKSLMSKHDAENND